MIEAILGSESQGIAVPGKIIDGGRGSGAVRIGKNLQGVEAVVGQLGLGGVNFTGENGQICIEAGVRPGVVGKIN